MIRKAHKSDLSEIKKLTEACAAAMIKKGIYQWNEHYPSKERLLEDVENEDLYLMEEQTIILGVIVLSPKMDREYYPVKWLTENKNNLYIHRLATQPLTWGSGHGRKLMDFAEDYARKNNYRSVRLDTFSQNKRNQKFYESRGYKKLGTIFFPKQSKAPFHCYELVF